MIEERVSKLADRSIEIIQYEWQKNTILKNEQRLGDLWDKTLSSNFHIIGVPEGGEKECAEQIFEDILTENSPKFD